MVATSSMQVVMGVVAGGCGSRLCRSGCWRCWPSSSSSMLLLVVVNIRCGGGDHAGHHHLGDGHGGGCHHEVGVAVVFTIRCSGGGLSLR